MADTLPAVKLTPTQLFLTFVRIGSMAWGGGASTLAMMHAEFVSRRPVVPDDEFQVMFSVSRIVPGMNLLALAVLLGHRVDGFRGAILSLTGLSIPSFTLIVLGCLLLRDGDRNPVVAGILKGLRPAVAALLTYTCWQLCEPPLRQYRGMRRLAWAGVVVGAAVMMGSGWLHPAWVVVAGAAAGALLAPLVIETVPKPTPEAPPEGGSA